MDSRYRLEKRCEEIQTNLEKLIGQNPDDDQAIDDLWRVQIVRWENACSLRSESETWNPTS